MPLTVSVLIGFFSRVLIGLVQLSGVIGVIILMQTLMHKTPFLAGP